MPIGYGSPIGSPATTAEVLSIDTQIPRTRNGTGVREHTRVGEHWIHPKFQLWNRHEQELAAEVIQHLIQIVLALFQASSSASFKPHFAATVGGPPGAEHPGAAAGQGEAE